ncbi:MAG: metallopeptidase TldD-related protein [bacterium]|nr:metallopeptidase TldD-related protein [bacterium]
MDQIIDLFDLRQTVEWALEIIGDDATLVAAEVCASWCESQTAQIRYTADRAADSVQGQKAHTVFGIGILVVVEDQAGRRIGFGSDQDDFSRESIVLALDKAKANAVPDPYFTTLPPPPPYPALPEQHDADFATLQEDTMLRLGNEALNGALSTLRLADYFDPSEVSGEVCSRMEHLMVGHTNGLLAGGTSTALMATVQCNLLREQSQGVGNCSATHLDGFAAYDAGADAAEQALQTRDGIKLDTGVYPVVFGPDAVADLLQDLILPALSLDTVAAACSPFAHRLGQQIASPLLTVTDNGRLAGMIGSRMVTGEGLPTGATILIDGGHLRGFLTDFYHAQKLATQVGLLTPCNGRRVATNGQSFAMRPGIFPTNVVLSSDKTEDLEQLLAPLTNAIYVDRLWHTYAPGGLHTGAFTSTVIGSSCHIVDGKLAHTLQPGTLRLDDNFLDLLQRITGLSTARQAVASPCMQSLVLTPHVCCSQAHFIS